MAEKFGLHVAVGGGDLVCGQRRSRENPLQEREGTFQTRTDVPTNIDQSEK